MLNEHDVKKNWTQIKSQILKKWHKLNEADVNHTNGNTAKLKKLVQDRYGLSERFDLEFERICKLSAKTKPEPYKSPNMVDGWKKGSGVSTVSSASKESEASSNPGTDSTWGYQNLDTNTEQTDIDPGGQTNVKDFMQIAEPTISDRSYSEAPDEFSPNQDPSLSATDVPLGGIYSSASNSSAKNAVFNSFEDHSRSIKKL